MKSTSLPMTTTPPPKQEGDKPSPPQEESVKELVADIHGAVGSLNCIWDDVLLDAASRNRRVHYALGHLKALLRDIVNSEGDMLKQIERDIAANREDVAATRKLLGMPDFDDSAHRPASVPLLKALEEEQRSLELKKTARLRKQLDLHEQLEKLCRRADADVDEALFAGINEKIFSEDELDNMRGAISELYDTLAERLERVTQLQSESKRICETISSVCCLPSADQHFLAIDFSSPAAVLSREAVERSGTINEKLREEHDAWMERIAERYDELLVKMSDLSRRCCRGELSGPTSGPVQSEEKLRELEEDYKRMQERYERGGPVFDKLNEWLALWRERLDSEQRACRTSFYNNRGGSLTHTLKRNKALDVFIPKVFDELCRLSGDYASKYGADDILVDGFRPDKYVQAIIEEYEHDKEMARAKRQFEKRGGAPPSDSTSSSAMTRTNTPKALGPAGPLPKTPSTTTLERKRSIGAAKVSAIPPMRPPVEGPLSSTPKPTPQKPPANNDAKSTEKLRPTPKSRPWS